MPAKKQTNKKSLPLITIGVSLGLVGLVLAYVVGVQQGRFLVTEGAKSTIVEALDAAQTETKVDKVVAEVDEEATSLKIIAEQIEAEAAAKNTTEKPASTSTSKESTKTTTTA